MSENISTLRSALFETLQAVKAGTMAIDQARAVNDLAKTLVDTARVEVQYLEVTGKSQSDFIEAELEGGQLPNGIQSITRHRLAG